MRLRHFILSVTLAFVCSPLCSQSRDTIFIPDTLIANPAKVYFVASLTSVPGDTIYTLTKPAGYVIECNDYSDVTIKIAIKTRGGYNVFNAVGEGFSRNAFSCNRINFNDVGNEELLIRWDYQMGRSGFMDGWNEYSSGFFLFDLDQAVLLFEIQDRYEHNYWWTGVEMDSTGQYLTDSLGDYIYDDSSAGGESECENYITDIGLNTITVTRVSDCPNVEEESSEILPASSTTYILLTPSKKKKK